MADRNQPMRYDVTIEEIATKKTSTAQVGCWWSDDASIRGLSQMCDCQIGGYFHAKPIKSRDGEHWMNAFAGGQFEYLRANECGHEPSKKFRAVKVQLPNGKTIQIAA